MVVFLLFRAEGFDFGFDAVGPFLKVPLHGVFRELVDSELLGCCLVLEEAFYRVG